MATKKFPEQAIRIIDILSLRSDMSEKLKKHDSSLVGVDYASVMVIFDQLLEILTQFGPLADNLLYDYIVTHKRHVKKREQRLDLWYLEHQNSSEDIFEQVSDLESQLEELGVDPKKLLRFEKSKQEIEGQLEGSVSELCSTLTNYTDRETLKELLGA